MVDHFTSPLLYVLCACFRVFILFFSVSLLLSLSIPSLHYIHNNLVRRNEEKHKKKSMQNTKIYMKPNQIECTKHDFCTQTHFIRKSFRCRFDGFLSLIAFGNKKIFSIRNVFFSSLIKMNKFLFWENQL